MKVRVIKVIHRDRVSAKGKAFTSVGLQYEGENGPAWANGFGSPNTRKWQPGQEVEVELEQKGDYLNFKEAGNAKQTRMSQESATSEIIAKLDAIIQMLSER